MPDNPGSLSPWLAWLRNWWRADQIRISPIQGKLLRIQPPCLLEIEGQRLIVRSRQRHVVNNRPSIHYHCINGSDESELWVFPPTTDQWQCKIIWLRDNERRWVEESLVTVYPLK